ncbi:MAG: Exodeoxyribonuclease VII large subunit, partial [uncultured Gemmatimonadaceae bacterium]
HRRRAAGGAPARAPGAAGGAPARALPARHAGARLRGGPRRRRRDAHLGAPLLAGGTVRAAPARRRGARGDRRGRAGRHPPSFQRAPAGAPHPRGRRRM